MTTPTHTRAHSRPATRRIRPLLVIAPLAAALGALGGLAASSSVFALAGAAGGLVWTALAALLAGPLLRLRDRSTVLPAAVALAAAFITTLTLGAGLVQHLMYPTPEAYLALMRSPASGGATGLYMMINPLLEWLLIPAALTLAWRRSRQRRLLLIGATVYYLQRLTTYLYFAPTVLGWTTTSDAVPLPQVGLWLNLDLARMTLDLAVIVILATTALRRHDQS
ncbi:hypothetical protein [Nonomuraea sp. NEAU-A123]|uniref:hypothetical protein n=1 Tax=Nonomuraea sp. NEAU-A123 TaxID=2839649 RepID=UPI001BE431E4|nr:hypothetical protein [Nonomuraea sp. NEAU-A123]MBT2233338.1 hypothetical protein [Nonomuraea sp. NEAU-A123]